MITALFKLKNYINEKNAVFYMGFLFNLLRIIEGSMDSVRDRPYLDGFYQAVTQSLNSP